MVRGKGANMKNDKLHELVKLLLLQHDYITIHAIADRMHVSERTVHNYISSQTFKEIIQHATLRKVPNKGIRLETTDIQKASIVTTLRSSIQLQFDKEDDVSKILLSLLSTKMEIELDTLCNSLFISPSTLHHILQEIEHYISKFNCTILLKKRKGFCLQGSEANIRKLCYASLMDFIHEEEMEEHKHLRITKKTMAILCVLMHDVEIEKIISIMNISETMINTNYCDEDYNKLLIHLAIIVHRNRLGYSIHNTNYHDITTSQEFYFATLKKTYLEKEFQIHLDENETCYLALLLLGTRKQVNVENPQQNMVVLEKFITFLSIRLNIELSNDFELKQNLISHLKPAIHRMRHGVVSENPLLQQIRLNYTEIYMAVITTIEDLEYREHIFFDSNEIGYICLHIIAAVNRPNNKKKVKTALICNEGLSIELFLKNLIESYFTEITISEIYRENTIQRIESKQFDLIINSSKQKIEASNIVDIDTNFTELDHDHIRHYLIHHSLEVVQFDDLYKNYLVFFQDTLCSQAELIKKYCTYLLKQGYVKEGFYHSVLTRTRLSSTYVARGIALPHGAKDEVISSVILMIRLDQTIKWDHEDTDFVILVAANDVDIKNYSFLFRRIMKIAACDEYATILKECQSLEDLKHLLDKL